MLTAIREVNNYQLASVLYEVCVGLCRRSAMDRWMWGRSPICHLFFFNILSFFLSFLQDFNTLSENQVKKLVMNTKVEILGLEKSLSRSVAMSQQKKPLPFFSPNHAFLLLLLFFFFFLFSLARKRSCASCKKSTTKSPRRRRPEVRPKSSPSAYGCGRLFFLFNWMDVSFGVFQIKRFCL
jgi:hypothetical protein